MAVTSAASPLVSDTLPGDMLDDRVAAVRLQLSRQALGPIQAALGADIVVDEAGWRPHQAVYRPGKRLTVLHTVPTRGPNGSTNELVVTDSRGAELDATIVDDGTTELAVWRMADDPFLPGLAKLLDPDTRAAFTDALGLPRARTARVRSYRPSRRAVVELATDKPIAYVKVVEPRRIRRLIDAFTALESVDGVARCHGWSEPDGLLLIEALQGTALDAVIRRGDALPTPDALVGQLDALPALDGPVVEHRRSVRDQARLLRALVPHRSDDIDRLHDAIGATEPSGDLETVHGDFHAGQVITAGGQIVGLVDVDRAGLGHRADDLGMFLAHLQVLALDGGPDDLAATYLQHLSEHWSGAVPAQELRTAIARSLFSFAPGGFTAQSLAWREIAERRLDAARNWLDA
jgi:hypothetical protein